MSSWDGSALPRPLLHTGQLYRWTHTSPFGRHGHDLVPRSCAQILCHDLVPRSQTSTIGPRAFAISSPSAWNSLPVDLRDPGLSLMIFRRRLKTYLFSILLAARAIGQLFLHCICLWTASGFCRVVFVVKTSGGINIKIDEKMMKNRGKIEFPPTIGGTIPLSPPPTNITLGFCDNFLKSLIW